MALYKPQSDYDTTLASSITLSDTSLVVATAPTETAGYLVLEPGTSNMEIIKYTGVSGTTLTGLVRGLAKSGTDDATSVTANQKSHSAGSRVVMADAHYYFARLVAAFQGDLYSGANSFYFGNSADSNITVFAANGDAALPYFMYSAAANAWVVSNDGVSSYKISDGGSGVTAGDGIDITAGAVSVDVALSGGLKMSAVSGDNQLMIDTGNSNIFTNSSAGSADAGKAVKLSASGTSAVIAPVNLPYASTPTEVDRVCQGANVSATAANISALVNNGITNLHSHGVFNGVIKLTAGAQTITGAGFTPKMVDLNLFVGNGVNFDSTFISHGAARHSAAQTCVYRGSAICGSAAYLGFVYGLPTNPGTSAAVDFSAFTDDGFVINVPFYSAGGQIWGSYSCIG